MAARACQFCGERLPRKPLPLAAKIGAGVAAASLIVWGGMTVMAPPHNQTESELAKTARRVATGPRSPEHANTLKQELDDALKVHLKKYGAIPTAELAAQLQKALPASTFEVHVFDLPKKMRIVEVDTVLQASEFLVMPSDLETKVFSLNGIEVFDGARVISDTSGTVLVLLGHSAGQGARHPQVKVYALLPDSIADRTHKAVAPIKGEGVAQFLPNNRDILADISLYSVGSADGVFKGNGMPSVEDETVHTILEWKDGTYKLKRQAASGTGPLSALYAVARSLQSPSEAGRYSKYFESRLQRKIGRYASASTSGAPNFSIVNANGKTSSTGSSAASASSGMYTLISDKASFDVNLTRVGNKRDSNPDWVASYVVPNEKWRNASSLIAAAQKANVAAQAQLPPAQVPQQATIVERKPDNSVTAVNVEKPVVTASLPPQMRQVINQASNQSAESGNDDGYSNNGGIAKEKEKPKAQPNQPTANNDKQASEKAAEKAAAEKSKPERERGNMARTILDPVVLPIRVRKGPSTDYRTLVKLGKGDQVEILGKENAWYKVRANGREGFIYGGLVNYDKSDAFQTVKVTQSMAVRDGRRRVATPDIGERLVVWENSGGSQKVKLANGRTGLLEKESAPDPTPEPTRVASSRPSSSSSSASRSSRWSRSASRAQETTKTAAIEGPPSFVP